MYEDEQLAGIIVNEADGDEVAGIIIHEADCGVLALATSTIQPCI